MSEYVKENKHKYNYRLKFVSEIISNIEKHTYRPKHNLKYIIEKSKSQY